MDKQIFSRFLAVVALCAAMLPGGCRAGAASRETPIQIIVPAERHGLGVLVWSSSVPSHVGSNLDVPYQFALVPEKKLAWMGVGENYHFALLGEKLVGARLVPGTPKMQFVFSSGVPPTNQLVPSDYFREQNIKLRENPEMLLENPRFVVDIEQVFGSVALRNILDSNAMFRAGATLPDHINTGASDGRVQPVVIKLVGPEILSPEINSISLVSVSGGKSIISVIESTNLTMQLVVDSSMTPISATTNGVSIGPIPTNCVFFSEVVSNKVVTRVVY